MTPETKSDYIRQAENYLQTVLSRKGKITRLTIEQCLLTDAINWRPKYFGKLRRAIVVQQESIGFKKYADLIAKLKHPATDELKPKADRPPVKKKIPKVKHVRANDELTLLKYFEKNKNIECMAAINIVRELGVRPAEIKGIMVVGDVFYITGAKKGKDRGLDRRMQVTEPRTLERLIASLEVINSTHKTIEQIQNNIGKAAGRIFKGRRAHYCLYSWRHQFAGELKASTMKPNLIAYLMGHQSTASIEQYGFRNRARGGLKVKPDGYDPEIEKVRDKPKSLYLKRTTTFKSQNVNLDNDLRL